MLHSYLTPNDYQKMLDLVLQLNHYKKDYRLYVLECLYNILGYEHMTFLHFDSQSNFIDPIGFNISSSLCRTYDKYYKGVDIFCTNNTTLYHQKFISITDLMSFQDYERTDYYNDFLKKDNLYYEIAMPLKTNNTFLGGIGLFKSKEDGNFSSRDYAMLYSLSDHISVHFNNFMQYTTKKEKASLFIKEDLPLTKRETEIALLVEQGLSNEEISKMLHISFHTVKTHLEHIYAKLGINNRVSMLHCLNQYRE